MCEHIPFFSSNTAFDFLFASLCYKKPSKRDRFCISFKSWAYWDGRQVSCFLQMCPFSLTYCILLDSSTAICWTSPFVIFGVPGLFCHFFYFWWNIMLANNVDPDQTLHYVASDLSLHCLPMTLSRFLGRNGLKQCFIIIFKYIWQK